MIAEESRGPAVPRIYAATTAAIAPRTCASEVRETRAPGKRNDRNGNRGPMYTEFLLELRALLDEAAACPSYVDSRTGVSSGKVKRTKSGRCPKPKSFLPGRASQFRGPSGGGGVPGAPMSIAPGATTSFNAGPPPAGGLGAGTQM